VTGPWRDRIIRRALGLSQEDFAARYHIPIGTLRDWEQGRSEPDQPARAYLTVIAHDPEGAVAAMRRHLRGIFASIEPILREHPEFFVAAPSDAAAIRTPA